MTQSRYNVTIQKWVPEVLVGTGDDVHYEYDFDNATADYPPFIPTNGEALLTSDYYLAFTLSSELPVSIDVFNLNAKAVSDDICKYCRQDWRIDGALVPFSVMKVCAEALRDIFLKGVDYRYKSYNTSDFGWTLADGITTDYLSPYYARLNGYRLIDAGSIIYG